MSCLAIRVEGIGKQFHYGAYKPTYSFRDFAVATGRQLLRTFRRMRETTLRHEDREAFWALRDISFDVWQGDVLAIIGRNGAGKSTLLKILARITDPTQGQIALWGRVGSLLEVGTGFHPDLTGRENIFLNGVILGMARGEIARKFDEIVAFSGVERFLDTPVRHYSSGMYMRLAFSVAAHLDPEILIIDEVLAVGDAEFQRKCFEKLDETAGKGRTILMVSHDLEVVRNLCSKAVWIDGGRVAAVGPAADVVAQYRERTNS